LTWNIVVKMPIPLNEYGFNGFKGLGLTSCKREIIYLRCARNLFLEKLIIRSLKMKKTVLAILAISMFAASAAMAEGNKQEISLSGYIDSSTDSVSSTTSTTTVIDASYGYYFSPVLLGRVVAQDFNTSSAGSTTSMLALGGGVKYYFGESKKSSWVPFVIGDLLAVSMDAAGSSGSGMGFDGGVGGSYFLTESVSFDVTGKLYSNSFTINGTTDTVSGDRIEFGFTARF
jgi:hypothetical protein